MSYRPVVQKSVSQRQFSKSLQTQEGVTPPSEPEKFGVKTFLSPCLCTLSHSLLGLGNLEEGDGALGAPVNTPAGVHWGPPELSNWDERGTVFP